MSDKTEAAPSPPENSPIRTPDDYSIPELDERRAKTLELLGQLENLWAGARLFTAERRQTSKGRAAIMMSGVLNKLFDVLAPPPPLTAEQEAALPPEQRHNRRVREKLLSMFHLSLGDQDHGLDPDTFEIELLRRRQHRLMVELELSHRFEQFARNLGDDALDAGEKVLEPGLKAFRFAKSAALHNKAFEALITPALDKAQKMTAAARKVQAEKRAQAAVAKAAKKVGKKGGKSPSGGSGGESGTGS